MDFKEIFNNKPRCQHFHEDGSRCKADPQTNSKFCFMHDPGQKEKQTEARKKGGKARFQPYEPKMPASFKYKSLNDRAQIDGFLDQLGLYLQRGEMDARTVRSYLFLASLKLSVRKDEAAERRWAERKAQKAGKEPEFFDETPEGRIMIATRQELLEYWRNRAMELIAAQNPDAATRKPPQPVPPAPADLGASRGPEALPKASPKPRSGEPRYPEDSSEAASLTNTAPPPKHPPQPAPAPTDAEMERIREEAYLEAIHKSKRSGWKRR